MITVSTSSEKPYHHGDLRQALLQAALELLAQDGPDALSLRAVARRAGVSAMAPYRHYADKESLLAAVAAQGFAGLRQVLRTADEAAPADAALVAQAVAYVRYALDNPSLFHLMFGPKRGGVHPGLQVVGEAAFAVLAGRVAAENPASTDPDSRVLGCWALVHGLALLTLAGRIKGDADDDSTRRIVQALLFPDRGG